MKITEVAKVASIKNPHNVDVRKIFESPDTSAVVITLKPGESLKKHVHRSMYFLCARRDRGCRNR